MAYFQLRRREEESGQRRKRTEGFNLDLDAMQREQREFKRKMTHKLMIYGTTLVLLLTAVFALQYRFGGAQGPGETSGTTADPGGGRAPDSHLPLSSTRIVVHLDWLDWRALKPIADLKHGDAQFDGLLDRGEPDDPRFQASASDLAASKAAMAHCFRWLFGVIGEAERFDAARREREEYLVERTGDPAAGAANRANTLRDPLPYRGQPFPFRGAFVWKAPEPFSFASEPGGTLAEAGIKKLTLACFENTSGRYAVLVPEPLDDLAPGAQAQWHGVFLQRYAHLGPSGACQVLPLYCAAGVQRLPQTAPTAEEGRDTSGIRKETPAPPPTPEKEQTAAEAPSTAQKRDSSVAESSPPDLGPDWWYSQVWAELRFQKPLPEFVPLKELRPDHEAFAQIFDEDVGTDKGCREASKIKSGYEAVYLLYRFLRTHLPQQGAEEEKLRGLEAFLMEYKEQREAKHLEKHQRRALAEANPRNVMGAQDLYRGMPYLFRGVIIKPLQVLGWHKTLEENKSGVRQTMLVLCQASEPKTGGKDLVAVLVPNDLEHLVSKDEREEAKLRANKLNNLPVTWMGLFLQRWAYIRRDGKWDAMPLYLTWNMERIPAPETGMGQFTFWLVVVFIVGGILLFFAVLVDNRRTAAVRAQQMERLRGRSKKIKEGLIRPGAGTPAPSKADDTVRKLKAENIQKVLGLQKELAELTEGDAQSRARLEGRIEGLKVACDITDSEIEAARTAQAAPPEATPAQAAETPGKNAAPP